MPDVFGEIVPDVGKVEKGYCSSNRESGENGSHFIYYIYMRYIYRSPSFPYFLGGGGRVKQVQFSSQW